MNDRIINADNFSIFLQGNRTGGEQHCIGWGATAPEAIQKAVRVLHEQGGTSPRLILRRWHEGWFPQIAVPEGVTEFDLIDYPGGEDGDRATSQHLYVWANGEVYGYRESATQPGELK